MEINPLCTNDLFHKLGMVHCIHKGVTGYISLKIDFDLANSVDPDVMPHVVAFHLGLHCLPQYAFRSYKYTKGYLSV